MTNQKIVPIGRKVLIKNRKASEYYEGTSILNTTAPNEFIADVVAVGDLVHDISIGDLVKYSEHSGGLEMKHDGEICLLVNCDMIFAKILNV